MGKIKSNRPIVGMVVTISPSFSLYRMVVFPAASKPTIRILISFFPKRFLKRPANMFPMVADLQTRRERVGLSYTAINVQIEQQLNKASDKLLPRESKRMVKRINNGG